DSEEAVVLPARPSLVAQARAGLERFGTWAKEKPVLAIGGGVSLALIIGLAVGGVSNALSGPEPGSESKPTAAASANPTSESDAPSPESQLPRDEGQKQGDEPPVPEATEEPKPSPQADEGAPKKTDKERVAEEKAAAEAKAAEEKAHADEVNR